jgi:glycosyltransferase involved in cell wall biosynthesis
MIARAVSSALGQCRPGDEVIVVDDGSTDGTATALAPYMNRIVWVALPHGGAGIARNQGVRRANKELVAFLDSDDEWMPGKLEIQRRFMARRPDILFCFSDFAVKDGISREEHNYLKNWHHDTRCWDEILGPGILYSAIAALPDGLSDFKVHIGNIYTSELTENYIFTGTLIVRRKEAAEALHFGEGLPTYEDWECFGRLSRKGPGAFFDCETAWQISHTGDRLTRADILNTATARITLMQRVWGEDQEFLRLNGDLYRRTLDQQRLERVRGLITHGDTRKARSEIRDLRPVPLSYRLLASMPGPVVSTIVKLKRKVAGG